MYVSSSYQSWRSGLGCGNTTTSLPSEVLQVHRRAQRSFRLTRDRTLDLDETHHQPGMAAETIQLVDPVRRIGSDAAG